MGSVCVRLAAGVLAAVAISLSACGTPEQVAGANWDGARATPKGMEHYPVPAARKNVTGWVMLLCRMGPAQEAQDCQVIAETPPGWGFAQAAIEMTSEIRARDGKEYGTVPPPPGALFSMPVTFCLPDTTEVCNAAYRPAQINFGFQTQAVTRLMARGRCREAQDSAALLNQPLLSSYVAGHCRARP